MPWRRRRPRPSAAFLSTDGSDAAVEARWAADVRVEQTSAAADWIAPRLLPEATEGFQVGSVVPTGFAAYVRIDHATAGDDDDDWAGTLPASIAEVLLATLHGPTRSEDGWFAVWDGWGGLPPGEPVLHHPLGRNYVLLTGPLAAATRPLWLVNGSMWRHQSPSLWWPNDRAWCVATEIDAPWTYVGASDAEIRRLLDDERLISRAINPDDPFTD